MMASRWSILLRPGLRSMLPVLGVVAALLLALVLASAPGVHAQDTVDPVTLLLTNDEAGQAANVKRDSQGEEGPSHWARRRWERERDTPDAKLGPLILENNVYVTRDIESAKQVYAAEVAKLPTFPEAFDKLTGTFPFQMTPIGDESSALSGCNDCLAKDDIFVHHRVVVRKGPAVTVVYTYGPDKLATQELTTWFAGQAASHIPDNMPVTASAPSMIATAPQPPAGEGSADADPGAGNSQPQAQQPQQSQPAAQVIQAQPKDLAIKKSEAGKDAEMKEEKSGADDKSSWYFARFERPRTYAGYRAGPVTVYTQVFVAKDRAAADQIYADQVKLNESFPEAKEKRGDVFELKDANEIGDQSRGLSACNASCNSDKEVYVHKRLVFRIENVVSVTYVWGLANPEGITDASARYFATIVAARVR